MRGIRKFLSEDEALAITEYAFLVAFVAIAVVGVITLFGGQLSAWLASRIGQITTT